MGKKGGNTIYESPEPTAAEKEIEQLLLGEIKNRQIERNEMSRVRQEQMGLFEEYFKTDYSRGAFSEEETAELDRVQGIFTENRTEALEEQETAAEKKLRQRWASQGISDSDIAGNSFNELSENVMKARGQIEKEGSLFRYGAEKDIRQASLQEMMGKIGILSSGMDTSVSSGLLGSLANQRSGEANRALQVALQNAANSGNSSMWNLLASGVGATVGGVIAGPPGAAVGAGVAGQARF